MSLTTITIDLSAEVADKLTRKAARQGWDAAGYVQHLAEREAETADAAVWDPPTLAAWDRLLDSFATGDAQDHREAVTALAQALNEDRPGQRRVFGAGTNPKRDVTHPKPDVGQSAE